MSLLIQEERWAIGVYRITEGVCMIQGIGNIAMMEQKGLNGTRN